MLVKPPVIFVHGGAGSWKTLINNYNLSLDEIKGILSKAAYEGFKVLSNGGSAIQAVVKSVKLLEDSGVFNAGVGSVLDVEGKVCMDAGIMDGTEKRAGAVACVSYPKNPIVLAEKVMELTDHIILCCKGADTLAKKLGLEPHPGPTPRSLDLWKKAFESLKKGRKPRDWWRRNWEAAKILGLLNDTVGAVALDSTGRLAAAASTGGISFKLQGRIGDSCIPGAGFYSNSFAAAAATGIGETIILTMLSLRAVEFATLGMSAKSAALAALNLLEDAFGKNTAGLILLTQKGEVASALNTEGMPRSLMAANLEKPITSVWPEDIP
jgi:beta-aspartyl-peptidase (threonine type)